MKLDTKDDRLSTLEIGAYFVLWILSVGYSIYNVFLISQDLYHSNVINLENGWLFSSSVKDLPDYEWDLIILYLKITIPWIILHLIVAEILRICNNHQLIPIWYTFVSTYFCIKVFGLFSTLLLWIQPCLTILLILLNNRTLTWVINIIIILLINVARSEAPLLCMHLLNIDEETYYMLMITISWFTLKSLSCTLDLYNQRIHNGDDVLVQLENNDVIQIFAYMMYLPQMMFGPIQLYSHFIHNYSNTECHHNNNFMHRFKILVVQLCRYFMWLIFIEISLHYVYITALQSNLQILDSSFWATYGLGYCMGQFFHIKYIVIYGLSTTIMKFENIKAPPTPKCIGRIHLYSYMWKYFDYGLYTFLVRYIYIPYGKSRSWKQYSKLFSSFLCFTFIYIWHGMQLFIFVWSFLNYFGVVIENLSINITQTNLFQNYIEKNVSKQSLRRIKALFATPLMISSALSNFFFFGGMDVGLYFVRKVFEANFQANFILFFFIYTLCQVSMEFMLNDKNKKLNK